MSKEDGYKIRNEQGIHFVTFAVVEWVDVFTRKEYRDIIVDCLKYCQRDKGLKLYGWCLMSNHIHLVIAAEQQNTSDLLRDFKKYTSKQIIKAILEDPKESRKEWMLTIFKQAGESNSLNKNYQFWRQDNQPKELFSKHFSKQKMEYIHNNPVEAGIVNRAEDYLYSSARNYCGMEGLIEVDLLEL